MHHEIIISGFGGQGVLFAGQLLAYAALAEGRHVTWIPSYGPEMRGGTAHCTVIISEKEIGSPLVQHPTAALVMNPPSMEKYAPLVKTDGVLILDATLIEQRSARIDLDEIAIPAKAIADELGTPQIANVVMLGALIAATHVVSIETMNEVIAQHLSARHRDKLEANQRALQRGADWAVARVLT
ncbi:MAG: 2-oxoacid:ferredoxin oxidoreductase subunit gamma [Chloroflexota bacterium]|nr:MAG: 2-oxoacid:ferredoxin oxidoreductase subunit gamma [Chloroflexota bacterium]